MAMKKSEKTWFDGELVPWDQATVHVSAHALHYGSSVFEGIRAYPFSEGPAIFCLEEHLDRLWASCKVYRMEIPYSRARDPPGDPGHDPGQRPSRVLHPAHCLPWLGDLQPRRALVPHAREHHHRVHGQVPG